MITADQFAQENNINTTPGAGPGNSLNNLGTSMQNALPDLNSAVSGAGKNIANAFTGGVNQVKQGYQQAETALSNPNPLDMVGQVLSGVGAMGSGIANAAISPIAPITQPIGQAAQATGNAISNSPAVQKFATSPAGQAVSTGAQNVANYANFAGGIAGGMAGADTAQNIWEAANTPTPTVSPETSPTLPTDTSSQTPVEQATAARQVASDNALKSLQSMNESAINYKGDLGDNFKAGAQTIEDTNPGTTMTLSHDQLDALNTLKDNKSFSLPQYLRSENIVPENPSDIENSGVKLTPTQAQDLITQLNRSTFTDKASGLGVDQSKIGLTNDIKNSATQAFDGPSNGDWSRTYGNFSKGMNALDSISDIVNMKNGATSSDLMKNMNTILKLGGDPEGKAILQNTINEFKNVSGIDLSDPTQTIMDTVNKQMDLESAEKGGYGKQFMTAMKNPQMLARRTMYIGMTILGLTALGSALGSSVAKKIEASVTP